MNLMLSLRWRQLGQPAVMGEDLQQHVGLNAGKIEHLAADYTDLASVLSGDVSE